MGPSQGMVVSRGEREQIWLVEMNRWNKSRKILIIKNAFSLLLSRVHIGVFFFVCLENTHLVYFYIIMTSCSFPENA